MLCQSPSPQVNQVIIFGSVTAGPYSRVWTGILMECKVSSDDGIYRYRPDAEGDEVIWPRAIDGHLPLREGHVILLLRHLPEVRIITPRASVKCLAAPAVKGASGALVRIEGLRSPFLSTWPEDRMDRGNLGQFHKSSNVVYGVAPSISEISSSESRNSAAPIVPST